MLTGGMFTASRALVLDTVLRESLRVENPPFGCLVAMPARDMLLIHVVRDQTVVSAFGCSPDSPIASSPTRQDR